MPRQAGKAYETMTACNGLQGRLLEYMRQKDLTLAQLAARTGMKAPTIFMWFKKNGALSSDGLQRVAELLGITFERALVEAGGKTGEERVAEQGELNKRHLTKRSAAQRREDQAKSAAAIREKFRNGYEMTPAHRAAISKAKKGTVLNLDKTTLRGKAQSMLGALHRHGVTRDEAEAEAIARLARAPYRITDPRVARALVRPKQRERTDWYQVIEWRHGERRMKWDSIGSTLDRDTESLRINYHRFLEKFTK